MVALLMRSTILDRLPIAMSGIMHNSDMLRASASNIL